MVEPETVVKLDTAAGLITARARCKDGRCLSVSLDNVPAFALQLDQPVKTPKWGTIRADIAFGGVFYALVDVQQIGLTIVPDNARALAEAGIEIKALLKQQVKVAHPEIAGLDEIAYVMFRDRDPDGAVRTCTTLKPGRVDRSPCGTGSSANLAVLHAQGRGEGRRPVASRARSSAAPSGPRPSARRRWATSRPCCRASRARPGSMAREELRIDPDDPFLKGFALSDTWGPQVGELG